MPLRADGLRGAADAMRPRLRNAYLASAGGRRAVISRLRTLPLQGMHGSEGLDLVRRVDPVSFVEP